MRMKLLLLTLAVLAIMPLQAQTDNRYIEVTGTSEIEIVPDKIHYIIEIREYFEEALKAAKRKAAYLVGALGEKLGNVIRIVENGEAGASLSVLQSNVRSSDANSYDNFRTIKKNYSMLVRFEIVDK